MQELWALMLEKTNSKPAEAVPGQKPTASAGKEAVKPEVSSSEYEEESSDTNGPAESEPPKATNVAAAKKAVDAVKEDKPAEQREDAQEEQPPTWLSKGIWLHCDSWLGCRSPSRSSIATRIT